MSFAAWLQEKLKVSIFDRKWSQQMPLSVPLLRLKPRRDAFILGQCTQIFLRGLIISRSFWLNLDLLLLDAMGSQFLMRRRYIRYYTLMQYAMDISVNGSKTIVGGKPEVLFHDPHLPMPSFTSAKSLHSSLAFLEVTPQDSVCLCTGSYSWARRQKKGRGFASSSCATCSTHVAGLDVRSRGNGCAPLGWMRKGAWTIRSLSAILTIALFPSSPTWGHAREEYPAQGWQQLWLKLAGPAQQVLVQGCLHLPRPAQLYLYAAGDGHQLLWSGQGCCLEEPSKDCYDMLRQRDHNVPMCWNSARWVCKNKPTTTSSH